MRRALEHLLGLKQPNPKWCTSATWFCYCALLQKSRKMLCNSFSSWHSSRKVRAFPCVPVTAGISTGPGKSGAGARRGQGKVVTGAAEGGDGAGDWQIGLGWVWDQRSQHILYPIPLSMPNLPPWINLDLCQQNCKSKPKAREQVPLPQGDLQQPIILCGTVLGFRCNKFPQATKIVWWAASLAISVIDLQVSESQGVPCQMNYINLWTFKKHLASQYRKHYTGLDQVFIRWVRNWMRVMHYTYEVT